jgi:uncharacterized protein DUF3008
MPGIRNASGSATFTFVLTMGIVNLFAEPASNQAITRKSGSTKCQLNRRSSRWPPGAALAAKRGEWSKASLKGASRQMVSSMSEQQLVDFAKTKRKGLPRKKTG